MESLMTILGSIAVFAAGLLVRLGVLVLFLAAVAVPVFAVVMGIRGYRTLRQRAVGVTRADGLSWVPDNHYAPGHTWVRHKGGGVMVGLDDLAQRIVRGAAAVQLPRLGAELHEGEVASIISCGPRKASVASPVDGTVTAVNGAVRRDPSLIRRDPYVRGWLFKVTPANTRFADLPRGESALNWLKEEATRLTRFLERDLGVATADGGDFRSPPSILLGDEGWEALTRSFLKTASR